MTGIAQCGNNVTTRVQTSLSTLLTLAEHAACMADPRYLTWRLMTISMEYDGSINWYRTDSYWDPSAMVIASSWGPMHGSGVNAGHYWSGADNTIVAATTTDAGKSYVFALSDGTGVQMSHITGGAGLVSVPSTFTTAGTGSNTLTTASASFTNLSPDRVD